MKAAVLQSEGNLQVKVVEAPIANSGELRLKVRLAGICGSDNSMYHGKLKGVLPVIPGHEAVGVIDMVGSTGSSYRPGQRVTIHPNYYCGECKPCRRGLTNICANKIRLGIDINGVFADYVVVPEKAVYLVPETLSDEVAVFTEPLSVAVHALNQQAPTSDDRVLVFGAGVMGQLTLQLALQKSPKVTTCDLIESRLDLARRMGAYETFGMDGPGENGTAGYDLIYETSGTPAGLEQAINLATPGGRIVLLGLPGQSYPVSTVMIVRKELAIFGSMIYTKEFPQSLELLAKGIINTEALVSGIHPLEELSARLEDFSEPHRMKTLIRI